MAQTGSKHFGSEDCQCVHTSVYLKCILRTLFAFVFSFSFVLFPGGTDTSLSLVHSHALSFLICTCFLTLYFVSFPSIKSFFSLRRNKAGKMVVNHGQCSSRPPSTTVSVEGGRGQRHSQEDEPGTRPLKEAREEGREKERKRDRGEGGGGRERE
jgi:hypothetical protein